MCISVYMQLLQQFEISFLQGPWRIFECLSSLLDPVNIITHHRASGSTMHSHIAACCLGSIKSFSQVEYIFKPNIFLWDLILAWCCGVTSLQSTYCPDTIIVTAEKILLLFTTIYDYLWCWRDAERYIVQNKLGGKWLTVPSLTLGFCFSTIHTVSYKSERHFIFLPWNIFLAFQFKYKEERML